MRDRTDEFNQKVLEGASQSRASVSTVVLDENKASMFVNEFLIKVEAVYDSFSKIDKKIEDVTELHSKLLESSRTDQNLFVIYEEIKQEFRKIVEKIEEIENSIDFKRFCGSDTELLICNTQLMTLRRKLTCSVSSYYNIQEEFKRKCKDRMKRQAIISGVDMSKIDFDTAVGAKTNIFMQAIFPDYNVAHSYMNKITERHEEFLKLERSMLELRDLIFDLNLILRADNAFIQRIDKHSQVVEILVAEAKGNVKDYKRSRKTDKFKNYICYCCCGVVIVIFVLAILSTFA